MRLTALNPRWIAGRVGMTFDCPGQCCAGTDEKKRLFVLFEDAAMRGVASERRWHRTGDSFDNLTLAPSLDWSSTGHWHGFVRNGEVV